MSTTIFLAQIWGPVILAAGLGFFLSKDFYIKIYRDIEKEPLAVLVFGMAGMAAGITHILAHNVWDSFPEGVISMLGWALLIKGAVFTVMPGMIDKWGGWAIKVKLHPVSRALTLVIGVYIVWLGYFA